MKKLNLLFAIFLIAATMVSCNKEMTDDGNTELKAAYVKSYSNPVSQGGITPVILAVDKPRGGNVSCADVNEAFGVSLICGDKINFTDEAQFEGAFPEWLNIDVNGIYISFNMDECVQINDGFYRVGAVIVKGSNASNVYYYPEGALGDAGLAAPGNKYMVSNLTFCFIECKEEEELVVAIKSWYWENTSFVGNMDLRVYTVSSGTSPFVTGQWCDRLGVNPLTASTFPLMYDAGNVSITEGWPEGVHSWIITIDLADGMVFDETSLYVGSLSGLLSGTMDSYGCPKYSIWPYHDYSDVNTHVFTIPY